MALFIILAALAAVRLAARPTSPPALPLGVLLGLGGATKLSPILISLPLAALGAGLLAWTWWRSRRAARFSPIDYDSALGARRSALGVRLLALPLIAFATFVAVYPYLWRDPIGHTQNLIDFRADEMALQARNWPNVAVESRAEAFR